MGQRLVSVSREFLTQLLQFPAEMEIVAVLDDPMRASPNIVLKVESSAFSEISPRDVIPYIDPWYSSSRHDCGHIKVKLTEWHDGATSAPINMHVDFAPAIGDSDPPHFATKTE